MPHGKFKGQRAAKPHANQKKCDCGAKFIPTHKFQTLCKPCEQALEHDANVEMFGADAEYLETVGLADKIGNK